MQLPLIGETLIQAIGRRLRVPRFGDNVDYFHYRYTSILLLFMLAWVLYHLNISKEPIICWINMEISKDPNTDWKRFIYDYCFIEGTYFSKAGEPLRSVAGQKKVTYYQWVPVILAMQSLCFYAPYFLWKSVNWGSGLHFVSILTELRKLTEYTKFNDRQKPLEKLADYLRHILERQQRFGVRGNGNCSSRYRGTYLSVWYLIVKLLFIINAIGQFFFLAFIVGENNYLWGFDVVRDLVAGRDWKVSGNFPRVTYCDFPRRNSGGDTNVDPYQCLLKINLINEKIFLILYFWFVFLSLVSIFNLAQWFFRLCCVRHRYRMISRFLFADEVFTEVYQRKRQSRDCAVEHFVRDLLKADGSFVLYIVGSQVSDILACQITGMIYKQWEAKQKKEKVKINGILPSAPMFPGDKSDEVKDERPSILALPTPEKNEEIITVDTTLDEESEVISPVRSDEPLVPGVYTDDDGNPISKTKWRKLQWHKDHPNG